MKNVIQLQRGFINLPSANQNNENEAMMVASELLQLGHVLNLDAINMLKSATVDDIKLFRDETVSYLRTLMGAGYKYTPFWKNFPNDVMQKSEIELVLHQIAYYITNRAWDPSVEVLKPRAFELSSYRVIVAGDEKKFRQIFTDLVSVNNSLTPQDKKTVEWFIDTKQMLVMPKDIPFKETLCLLALKKVPNIPVKTTTDVLRIAVAMSGGDIAMPKVPRARIKKFGYRGGVVDNPARDTFKFRKFTRGERRYLLSLLENSHCDPKEMCTKSRKGRWVRLGETLHPGDYARTFPKAYAAIQAIRNDTVTSFYGELEALTTVEAKVEFLKTRPGEFFRRLDFFIRTGLSNYTDILDAMAICGMNVSNKVLFEAFTHFENRRMSMSRSIMLKGARKRTNLTELPALPGNIVDAVQVKLLDIFKAKLADLDPWGKVYIDPELKKIPLPTNMRSVNESLKVLVRGSRLPIPNVKDGKVIRAFVHWKGNIDIDLTALFMSEDGLQTQLVGWNGSHNSVIGCYSGDITGGQGRHAEYVDIVYNRALAEGFRYVILTATSFSSIPFNKIEEACTGFEVRKEPSSNKTYLPSSMVNSMLLTSDGTQTIMCAFDLLTEEFIPIDSDLGGITVSGHTKEVVKITLGYLEEPKLSVYDLLKMHTVYRQGILSTEQDAEKVFYFKDFSESYIETLKLMGV
jgi:hypothetical protein